MEYKKATLEEYLAVWEKDIKKRPEKKEKWEAMREVYVKGFKENKLVTFIAKDGEDIIAQISIIIGADFRNVFGYKELCDGVTTVNMNAFRCDKEYEGQGHISRLVKMGEKWAKDNGYKFATIGANAENTRNTAIYLHFGYTTFVMHQHFEDGIIVLYYKKEL